MFENKIPPAADVTLKRSRSFFILRCSMIASLLAGVLASALQVYLFIKYYDEASNLYNAASQGIVLTFYIGVVIVCLVVGCSYFILKKTDEQPGAEGLPASGKFTSFAAMLSGLLLLCASVLSIYYYYTGVYRNLSYFRLAVMALAIPAGIYFILIALSGKTSGSVLGFFGMAVVAWAAIYLMCIYFEMTSPLNSPIRILNQFSLMGIMVYFLYETRFLLGIAKIRQYFMVSQVAVTVIALCSVSDVILTFIQFRPFSENTLFRTAECAILLYIIVRQWSVYRYVKNAPPLS